MPVSSVSVPLLARTSFLLLASLSACSTQVPPTPRVAPPAPAPEVAPATPDEAVRALIDAKTFEDVAISYDGHLSPGVRAFRVVFAAPDAADRFREVADRGTLVGQLYAAIGLRHHDAAAYEETVRKLRAHATERVPAQFGCLGSHELVGDLLESPEPVVIRLSRGQTFEQWMSLHKEGGAMDIVGGAYTSQFGQVPSRL